MSCEHYPPNGTISDKGFRLMQSVGCPYCRIAQLEAALRDIEGRCRWPGAHTPEEIVTLVRSTLEMACKHEWFEGYCVHCNQSAPARINP
jgi:hypothetical protein